MGMRFRSGESASKMNLLMPTGIGPTSRESSSWSCSELRDLACVMISRCSVTTYEVADPTYVSFHSRSGEQIW